MSLDAQNIHGTVEIESASAKWDLTPSIPLKKSLGLQNMKTGHDAFGIAKNESGSTKHENGARWPRYRRKRVRARKT
jgi:hypothetical protein